ncbi:MAG: hypothetical protein C0490_22615 [Marivirga sp.]|nr:hypothetical protein [Marivirga sp.]
MPKKLQLNEGDIFTFPLRSRGYASGLIIRASKTLTLLGCFYDLRYDSMPTEITEDVLKKGKIILTKRFGLQGFKDGTWKVVGKSDRFNRQDWPIPSFLRQSNPPRIITYNDELEEIKETVISNENANSFPGDGLAGSGFIEIVVTEVLDGKRS